MTDQFPAELQRLLRDIEVRLQRLESAARVKPGLQIEFPPPPTAADIGGMSGLSTPTNWPTAYSDAVAENVTIDLQMIRLYALAIRSGLVDAGIFI